MKNKSRCRTLMNPTNNTFEAVLSHCSSTSLQMESGENGSSNHEDKDSNRPLMLLPELPSELIAEILLRLPVKPLLKFKCVSKSWQTLISGSQFIKDHLRVFGSSAHKQQLQLLSGGVDGADFCYYLSDCSLTSLLAEQQPTDDAADDEIDHLPILRLSKDFKIVGFCDGLFCVVGREKGVFLWNPSTRKFKKLPNFSSPILDRLRRKNYYEVYGFGYDKASDDYKVVKVTCDFDTYCNSSGSEVIVYSVKTGSWKSIGVFQGGFPDMGVCGSFINGKLHWKLGYEGWNSVVFLDLATETFGRLDLARKGNGGTRTLVDYGFLGDLGTFGGNLSLFSDEYREHLIDLWVMKEYGVGESWTKVASIPIDKTNFVYRALCIPGSDSFLVVLKDELRLYNLNDDSFRLLSRSGNCNVLSIYVESLVSPNPDAADR